MRRISRGISARRTLVLACSALLATLATLGTVNSSEAQTRVARDTGWVRVTYTVTTPGQPSRTVSDSARSGIFPVAFGGGRPARDAIVRPQGCVVNRGQQRWDLHFNRSFGPRGMDPTGAAVTLLELNVGGQAQAPQVRYAGPGTFPLQWSLGERRVAMAWQFRPTGGRMWTNTVVAEDPAGSAEVTINPDERSGSFRLGPFPAAEGDAQVTVTGTFRCDMLMER